MVMVFKYGLKMEFAKLAGAVVFGFVQTRFYPRQRPVKVINGVWEGKKFMLYGTIGG